MEILTTKNVTSFASKLNHQDLKKLEQAFNYLSTTKIDKLLSSDRTIKVQDSEDIYLFRLGDFRLYISKVEGSEKIVILDAVKAKNMNNDFFQKREQQITY